MTAWMWALTSAVSCSRSARRNGRTWTEDMANLPGNGAAGVRGRRPGREGRRPLPVRYDSDLSRTGPAGQVPP